MPDTGEDREIKSRVKAREAELASESKKLNQVWMTFLNANTSLSSPEDQDFRARLPTAGSILTGAGLNQLMATTGQAEMN